MQWNRVITLEIRRQPPEIRRIASTKEAAICLLRDWPRKKGHLYTRAVRACADALKGELDDAGARHFLVDAAREAAMRVQISLGPWVLQAFDYELAAVCDALAFDPDAAQESRP